MAICQQLDDFVGRRLRMTLQKLGNQSTAVDMLLIDFGLRQRRDLLRRDRIMLNVAGRLGGRPHRIDMGRRIGGLRKRADRV